MPEESLSKPPTSNDPNSLANLLPEYFDDFQSAPSSPNFGPVIPPARPSAAPDHLSPVVPLAVAVRKTPPRPKRREGGFNYILLGVVGLIGIVVFPLLIFGAFVLIANSQPRQTTINIGSVSTPFATVFSITPGAGTPAVVSKTTAANGTPAAANPASAPTANPCPPQTAFGQVEYYTCAKTVQTGTSFSSFFGLAEIDLAQNGQNGPANRRVYAVSADGPAKVLAFYAASLPGQGYAISGATSNGTTSLGSYSAATYTKNGQQVQVVALGVNKASLDGQINAGQTLIRLSTT